MFNIFGVPAHALALYFILSGMCGLANKGGTFLIQTCFFGFLVCAQLLLVEIRLSTSADEVMFLSALIYLLAEWLEN